MSSSTWVFSCSLSGDVRDQTLKVLQARQVLYHWPEVPPEPVTALSIHSLGSVRESKPGDNCPLLSGNELLGLGKSARDMGSLTTFRQPAAKQELLLARSKQRRRQLAGGLCSFQQWRMSLSSYYPGRCCGIKRGRAAGSCLFPCSPVERKKGGKRCVCVCVVCFSLQPDVILGSLS